MTTIGAGRCAWAARRVAVSAFLVVHMSATALWVLPPCPLRARTFGWTSLYILPLGLWQYWAMFSPDPPTIILAMEAEAIDASGLRYNFTFPKQADYSIWGAIPRFRHPKLLINLADRYPEVETHRRIVARHVARQLALPAEAYPIDVHLIFQVHPCPPPGSATADVAPSYRPYPIGAYRFESIDEVRP